MARPEERVVFIGGLEGLVRALEPLAPPAFWSDLKKTGFDRTRLLVATPIETWLKVVEAGAALVGGPRPEALHLLGRRAIGGFQQTMVGGALLKLLSLIGLKRALDRITRAFRNGNNFLELTLEAFEPGTATLVARDVAGVGEHFAGMLVAGFEAVGAKEVRCDVEPRGQGARFTVRWREATG